MVKRTNFLFLALLIGLLLLAACGGDATSGNAASGSTTTGAADNVTAGDTSGRVKVDAALGSAPLAVSLDAAEGPASRGATGPTSDVAGVCLSAGEAELARMINEYRAEKGLTPYQISKSLSLVAQQHVWDSTNNFNNWPAPPEGKTCNMHSWSGVVNPALKEGTWTGLCYTNQHDNAPLQWIKPKEIAGYPGEANEISYAASAGATASGAMTAWKNSPGHNGALIDQGVVTIGVGMSGQFAHVWLSHTADPIGEPPLCNDPVVNQPTAVPPTPEQPTAAAPTAEPPTQAAPTAAVPTEAAPTAEQPTVAAPTAVPPTAVPPTAVPPTAVPPTAVPPTTAAPTGMILNQNGTIAAGTTTEHSFDVAQGRTYTVLVTPSAQFDVEPKFDCTLSGGGGASGGFDWWWEGAPETFTYAPPAGSGTCRITVGGYLGSVGTYTITVTAN